MAGKNLKQYLEKIEKDLQKDDDYRNKVSNVKIHKFYVSLEGLQSHIQYQMSVDGVKIEDSELQVLASSFFNELKSSFMGPLQNVKIYDRNSTNSSFYIEFQSTLKEPKYSTFNAIKYIYQIPKRNFMAKVKAFYKRSNQSLRGAPGREAFLDLGHAQDSAIVEQRVSNFLAYGEVPPNLQEVPEIFTLFDIQKIDSKDIIEVTFQSSTLNRSKGTEEKGLKSLVLQKIREAVEKLDTLNLDGSDSPVTKKRKETIKKVIQPFEKIKNATIQVEDLKINKSSSMSQKVKKSKKAVQDPSRAMARATSIPQGPRTKARQSTVSIAALMGLINARINDAVAENMGPPRLENRTGRFAASVRITDVTKTRKGFPSVGYTYQRDPYQVYESTSGSRFGSLERDPRTLIDKSIREIAAELAIGRIYTRRV